MNLREISGLLLVIAGAIVVPLGWIVSHKLLIIAAALVFVGGTLVYTGRVIRREEQQSREAGAGGPSTAMPGDINNSTGWRSGGRTETFESHGAPEGD